MKNKKKKIIILSGLIIMTLAGITAFAAFKFIGASTGTANLGKIEVNDKKFYSYAYNDGKMRVDTVAKLDDLSFYSTKEYVSPTESVFQTGKTYYVAGTFVKASVDSDTTITGTYYEDKDGNYAETSDTTFMVGKTYYTKTSADGYTATSTVTIGSIIDTQVYKVEKISYSGIKKIGSATDKDGNNLTFSIADDTTTITLTDSNEKEVCTVYCTMSSSLGVGSAKALMPNALWDSNPYYVVIDSDYAGLLILDKTAANSKKEITENSKSVTSVTCSATEDRQSTDTLYLNQLGFGFTFTPEVAVYARIHIQDAWIQTKVYSSNSKQSYSIKDQISGSSPFAISDSDWVYVASENTAYLKTMVEPEKDSDGNYVSHTYSFDVNPAYYYITSSSGVYKEYMTVQISFTVDLVQANRAEAIWGFDPSTLTEDSE